MKTALKSFRINQQLIRFLEQQAKEMGLSQSKLIEQALTEMLEATEQWENDLALIASDKEYQKEQEELAEEYYEDF